MPRTILVSAGEASGDLYAALLVQELRRAWPDATFFGCTGPRMRSAAVETIVDARELAVVGILEVVSHIPWIYKKYKVLIHEARQRKPDLAILTDAPDFHLRVARQLHRSGVPVVYLVAPQVWAWRKGRMKPMRRDIRHLLCIFPFEEQFFRNEGIPATYIGHPLACTARPSLEKSEFFRKHRLPQNRPLIAVLPGSRRGEASRHLEPLLDAVDRINQAQAASFLLPASVTTGAAFFRERIGRGPIQVIDGETWDAVGHADVALAASGTVAIEAAILGTPMVTFYKVTALSWLIGKLLVRVPFYSMVNLVAGRAVVPELMQADLTGERLAAEALKLLRDSTARARMQSDLAEVARKLSSDGDPMKEAAEAIQALIEGQAAHVS